MPKMPAETLEAFLDRQQTSTLVAVLLELADVDVTVKERLLRLQKRRIRSPRRTPGIWMVSVHEAQ